MGCGASKSVQVQATAPAAPLPATKKVVEVAAIRAEETKPVEIPAATPKQDTPAAPADKTAVSTRSTPEIKHITEDSVEADKIANEKRPPTPEFTLMGTGLKGIRDLNKNNRAARASDSADEAFTERETSASSRGTVMSEASVASVPTVQERPSSRGGLAFDMTFEGETSRAVVPARLESLHRRTRSAGDMTVEQLKQKLEAAEARRQVYEQRLKEKMNKETSKVEKVQAVHQEKGQEKEAVLTKATEKENKVLENRQASLQQLREKLRLKDEHAKKVREQKRLSLGLPPSQPVIVQ